MLSKGLPVKSGRKSGPTDSKPPRLFPLGPNEPEEVACGPLGLGGEQAVGRAGPALPAPSCGPGRGSQGRAVLCPHVSTRGRPAPPAAVRPASQRTPSGGGRNSPWRKQDASRAELENCTMEALAEGHCKSGTEEEMSPERGGWSWGPRASPRQSLELPSQVLISWI